MASIVEDMLKLEGRRECACGRPVVARVCRSALRFRDPDDSFVRDIDKCLGCGGPLSRYTTQPATEGDS